MGAIIFIKKFKMGFWNMKNTKLGVIAKDVKMQE